MSLPALLENLLWWGVYPLWLLAGGADYLCHRQTDIEHTSGSVESWFHLLQFLTLLIAIAAGSLLEPNALVFGAMVVAVVAHTVLAHLDVSYTDGQRYISPFEQLIHGFMDVLPLVAVALFGVLHWQQIGAGLSGASLTLVRPDSSRVLLLASFTVLAGVPILEELVRTLRHRGERKQLRYQAGFATIK
ncbi:diguanylate cyclase [Steroidobacter flavus]|uniref:Diguanylate cyclase n=1 Tax=Steroidobacter flavus TaxID=1842136 RepID=A0ABV8SP74_9GAMM